MDIVIYRQILEELIREALANSDGSFAGIRDYLHAREKPGRLTRNRAEKQRALDDARRAFDEHRHWPVEIVISHLGLDKKEMGLS